jgi:hypothetical protein
MEAVVALISAASGLAGVVIGAWLAARGERTQRKLAFLERRLNEFYAPLLRLRNEIKIESELRVMIQAAGEEGWQQVAASMENALSRFESSDKHFEPYRKLIEYDTKTFKDELLPAYRTMVSVFRENMSLAFPDTSKHFGKLVEFVSVWDRHLEGAIPAEVLPLLKHGEQNLHPFYENLQRRHDELVEKIAAAKPD